MGSCLRLRRQYSDSHHPFAFQFKFCSQTLSLGFRYPLFFIFPYCLPLLFVPIRSSIRFRPSKSGTAAKFYDSISFVDSLSVELNGFFIKQFLVGEENEIP